MSLCAQCDPISVVQKLRRASKRALRGKDELSQSLQWWKCYKCKNMKWKCKKIKMQKLKRSSRAKDELASMVKAHKNIRKI